MTRPVPLHIALSLLCAATAAACGKQEPPPAAEEKSAEAKTDQPTMAEPPPTSQPATEPAEPAAAPAAEPAAMPETPAGAKVSFLDPADGATVKGPVVDGKVAVKVKMGVEGIALKPAGAVEAGSGHHHVLVDTPPVARGVAVPADDKHIHFGKAQTEAEIPLAPGPHTLMLQFADGIHRSYGPSLATTIKITVEAE